MADAYIKTYEVDETFVLEDTNDGYDIQMFQLPADTPADMYMWSNAFVPASGMSPGLYAWVGPMPLDAEGDYIDNFYNNCGVLYAITNYSTYGDPATVRLHGQVKVMFLPVVDDPTP